MTGRRRAVVIAFAIVLLAGSTGPALARDVALLTVGRELGLLPEPDQHRRVLAVLAHLREENE